MAPTPCKHCGIHFMPADASELNFLLCNNCKLREERKNPKQEIKKMSTISILVTLPSEIHKSIEENCLARNIDFNQYFIDLLSNKISQSAHKICEKPICEAEPPAFIQNIDTYSCPDAISTKPIKIKLKNKAKK